MSNDFFLLELQSHPSVGLLGRATHGVALELSPQLAPWRVAAGGVGDDDDDAEHGVEDAEAHRKKRHAASCSRSVSCAQSGGVPSPHERTSKAIRQASAASACSQHSVSEQTWRWPTRRISDFLVVAWLCDSTKSSGLEEQAAWGLRVAAAVLVACCSL
uniref:Uncharacterized protein n=1 Tax=Oryza meridionalis TaxID=40149 RepID=A0A0E0FB21_9ORYZ